MDSVLLAWSEPGAGPWRCGQGSVAQEAQAWVSSACCRGRSAGRPRKHKARAQRPPQARHCSSGLLTLQASVLSDQPLPPGTAERLLLCTVHPQPTRPESRRQPGRAPCLLPPGAPWCCSQECTEAGAQPGPAPGRPPAPSPQHGLPRVPHPSCPQHDPGRTPGDGGPSTRAGWEGLSKDALQDGRRGLPTEHQSETEDEDCTGKQILARTRGCFEGNLLFFLSNSVSPVTLSDGDAVPFPDVSFLVCRACCAPPDPAAAWLDRARAQRGLPSRPAPRPARPTVPGPSPGPVARGTELAHSGTPGPTASTSHLLRPRWGETGRAGPGRHRWSRQLQPETRRGKQPAWGEPVCKAATPTAGPQGDRDQDGGVDKVAQGWPPRCPPCGPSGGSEPVAAEDTSPAGQKAPSPANYLFPHLSPWYQKRTLYLLLLFLLLLLPAQWPWSWTRPRPGSPPPPPPRPQRHRPLQDGILERPLPGKN